MGDPVLKSEYASKLTLANMEIHRLIAENRKLDTCAGVYLKALPIAFFAGFALAMLLHWLGPLKF